MKSKRKESNFVSVVVYLHQKEKNAGKFLERIYKIFAENFKQYEIICVSDDASDETLKEIKQIKEQYKEVTITILHMGFRHGIEASMNAGMDLAIGDYVFEFDTCSIDYEPALIMNTYDKCMEGYDIVSTRPKRKSKFMSGLFYRLFNCFSKFENKLATERFHIISRRGINRVYSYSSTIPFRKAIYLASGLSMSHIEFEPNGYWEETLADSGQMEKASDSLVLFTNIGYVLASFASVIMFFAMFGFGIYTVVSYLGVERPVEGWAPIMGLVSLGFCGMFVLMAIGFKYLDVLVRLEFNRQKYVISSIEKL